VRGGGWSHKHLFVPFFYGTNAPTFAPASIDEKPTVVLFIAILRYLKEPLAIFTRKEAKFFYKSRQPFRKNRFLTPEKRSIRVFCDKIIDLVANKKLSHLLSMIRFLASLHKDKKKPDAFRVFWYRAS
jgi:hypothetical protein